MTMMRDHKILVLLEREILDGKPWGPMDRVTGGGHYEIEQKADRPRCRHPR
jgi:hypothetical protein